MYPFWMNMNAYWTDSSQKTVVKLDGNNLIILQYSLTDMYPEKCCQKCLPERECIQTPSILISTDYVVDMTASFVERHILIILSSAAHAEF